MILEETNGLLPSFTNFTDKNNVFIPSPIWCPYEERVFCLF